MDLVMTRMFSRLMNATRYGTTHIFEFMSRLRPERPSDMRMELRTVKTELKAMPSLDRNSSIFEQEKYT